MTMPAETAGIKPADDGKIGVMLVDDSAVIRGLLAKTLESDKDIKVVSSVNNGQMAVNAVRRADPDVIILDIEMPVMDGITALPLLLTEKPGVKVLICSTQSREGAAISLKALSLGATECLVKPVSNSELGHSDDFKRNLLKLVKSIGARQSYATRTSASVQPAEEPASPIRLRDKTLAYRGKPSIVAIGSSTGGPQALFETLKHIRGIDIPIVITQHMPKTFTALLAEHIEHNCGIPAHEGAQNMHVEKGHAYVAPGGYHMELIRNDGDTIIHLDSGPAINFCKPSVDPMINSVIDIYGNKALGVMLTGMGSDGLESFRRLADRGGNIIAQDEKTSVVWGMPGSVATAGLCTAVLPVQEIGPWLKQHTF